MSQERDPLSSGCLYVVSTRRFGDRRKVGKDAIDGVVEKTGAKAAWVSGTKLVIPKRALKGIDSAARRGVASLDAISSPFPLKNARLVSYNLVDQAEERLAEAQRRHADEVVQFARRFEAMKEEARRSLGSEFDESVYPDNVQDSFSFSWRSFIITPPDQQYLTPEIYRRRLEDFERDLATFKQQCFDTLSTELLERLEHLSENLTPKPDGTRKKFHSTSVTHITDFLQTFSDRNYTEYDEFSNVVSQVREALDGVDPRVLMRDENLRGEVRSSLGEIGERLKTCMVDAPTRRIRLPQRREEPTQDEQAPSGDPSGWETADDLQRSSAANTA